jgi:pentatricopeptide repeat protein
MSRIYNGGGHRSDRRVVAVAKDDDAGENGPGRRNRSRNRSIRHSTRLIGEIAARRTTDLLLKAHDESMRRLRDRRRDDDGGGRATMTTTAQDDDGVFVRWDAAAILAAEQALEFWAHRAEYHDDDRRRDRRGGRDGWDRRRGDGVSQRDGRYSSTIEDDAAKALRLFAALHHFHLLANDANDDDDDDDDGKNEGAVLTNGMYSHVVDALAKSPNVEHVIAADALLRQFVSLCVGRRRGGGSAGGPAAENEMPRHRSSPPIDDCTTGAAPSSFEDPGGLRWNDGDRHHLPNHVRITGVMRGYARHSRPRDAERLLDLMMSLSSCSSSSGVVGDPRDRDRRDRATMFRPNDVGYATVIDAYSRAQDGPNAERILGMMKRRGGGRDDDDDERGNGNRANVVAYNAAISAWARSARERRAPPPPPRGGGGARRDPPAAGGGTTAAQRRRRARSPPPRRPRPISHPAVAPRRAPSDYCARCGASTIFPAARRYDAVAPSYSQTSCPTPP